MPEQSVKIFREIEIYGQVFYQWYKIADKQLDGAHIVPDKIYSEFEHELMLKVN